MADAKPELVQLNWRYRPALMAFFLRRLRNHAEAEDLTQEVFTRLAVSDTTSVQNADSYVFQIAANLLRDRARRQQIRTGFRASAEAAAEESVDTLDPSRILIGRQALDEVASALRELPLRTQAIFLLYRLENMKQAEIAGQYGMTVSGVQKHLVKAMAHLMARLGVPK